MKQNSPPQVLDERALMAWSGEPCSGASLQWHGRGPFRRSLLPLLHEVVCVLQRPFFFSLLQLPSGLLMAYSVIHTLIIPTSQAFSYATLTQLLEKTQIWFCFEVDLLSVLNCCFHVLFFSAEIIEWDSFQECWLSK